MEIQGVWKNEDVENDKEEEKRRRLFETAEWTLLRLNQTIDEMKCWTQEREVLQGDVFRLRIALGYSEKLLADPLVIHQSQEIQRLERVNSNMRHHLRLLSKSLTNAESTASWRTSREMAKEMANLKYKMAEERQQLVNEIVQLRSRLNLMEIDATNYCDKVNHLIQMDSNLDQFLAMTSVKLIQTVDVLSTKLTNLYGLVSRSRNFQNIVNIQAEQKPTNNNPNRSLENVDKSTSYADVSSHSEDAEECQVASRIQTSSSANDGRVRALESLVKRLKTRLLIAQQRFKRLTERLSSENRSVQTAEFNANPISSELERNSQPIAREYDYEENVHYYACNKQRSSIEELLEIERTTAREALKQFESIVKENDRKSAELENLEGIISNLKEKYNHLKITYAQLKSKVIRSNNSNLRAKIKRMKLRELFINRVNNVKLKNRKKSQDLQTIGDELLRKNERILFLESEVTKLSERSNNNHSESNNSLIKNLDIEMIHQESKLDDIEIAKTNESCDDVCESFTSDFIKTEDLARNEGVNYNQREKILDDLKGDLETELKFVGNANDTKNTSAKLDIVACDYNNTHFIINNTKCGNLLRMFDVISEKTLKNLEIVAISDENRHDELIIRGKYKSMDEILSREVIMNNFEETDRQLSTVKLELSLVRRQIVMLRGQLDSKRMTNRRVQAENLFLREEMAALRSKIVKIQEENRLLKISKLNCSVKS